MQNTKNTAQVIGAVLIGVTVGAVVGMLFAPEKGSKTRKRLLQGAEGAANDLKNTMKDQMNTLRDEARHMEQTAKNKVDEFAHGAKNKLDEFGQGARNKVDEMSQGAKNKVDNMH